MPKPELLTGVELKYEIQRQEWWKETYRTKDPSSPFIATCDEIITLLKKELSKRGPKCQK